MHPSAYPFDGNIVYIVTCDITHYGSLWFRRPYLSHSNFPGCTSPGCSMCAVLLGEHADMSLSKTWVPKSMHWKTPKSIIDWLNMLKATFFMIKSYQIHVHNVLLLKASIFTMFEIVWWWIFAKTLLSELRSLQFTGRCWKSRRFCGAGRSHLSRGSCNWYGVTVNDRSVSLPIGKP